MDTVLRSLHRGSVHRAALGAITASLVNQVALIVSGVVFARALGPQGRGNLALLLLLPAVVFQIGNLGVPTACAYYIARSSSQGATVVHNLRRFVPVQALVLVLVHIAAIGTVIWPRGSALHLPALITLAWTPALLVQEYGLAILQGQRRFVLFNTLWSVPALIYAFTAAALLLKHEYEVGPVISMLTILITANAVITVNVAIRFRRTSLGDTPTLRQLLTFGVRGLLGSSYPVETLRLDQLIVGLFFSASDLGLYVVAMSFSNLPRFISQGIGFVAYPQIAAEPQEVRQRRAMWRFFLATTGITVLVVCLLEVSLPAIVQLFFGTEFVSVVPVARVLLIAAVVFSSRRILAEAIRGAGYPAAGSIAELVSLAVLMPAFLFLSRSFHLVGIALALTLGAAVSLVTLLVIDNTRDRWPITKQPRPTDRESALLDDTQSSASP